MANSENFDLQALRIVRLSTLTCTSSKQEP